MTSKLSLLILCTVASLHSIEAWTSCTWTEYKKHNIPGGEGVDVNSLAECQAACLKTDGCQSLDFNPVGNGCWLLKIKETRYSHPDVDHYDHDCQEIDPCAPKPCQNGGVCSEVGETYSCSCPAGYSGQNCETYDACHSSPCHNGGQCHSAGDSFTCECPAGYSGATCDAFDACHSSPCHNGGQCHAAGDSFTCECPAGYSGATCDAFDACHSSPCHNGGQCSAAGDSFTCSCPLGFSGPTCDEKGSKDLVENAGYNTNIKTNYQGPVTDFSHAKGPFSWDFNVATFGFDWPQANLILLPVGGFVYVNRIQFTNSDNLGYFRVAFTKTDGKVITTDPIFAFNKNFDLTDIKDVARVDFFLSPIDYRRPVTVSDIKLNFCAKDPFLGVLGTCQFFDLFKFAASLVTLGGFTPGATGGFSVSATPDYPFVELDWAPLGKGPVEISEVKFGGIGNFNTVILNVWNGANPVPITGKDGKYTSTFDAAQGIKFGAGVKGDRIRATIIPNCIAKQGTGGAIGLSKYSVLAA